MVNKNEKAIIIGLVFVGIIFLFTIYRPEIDFQKIWSFFGFSNEEKVEQTKQVDETPGLPAISVNDLKEALIKNPDSIFLIDIREESDYQIAHIIGSINLPPDKMTDTPTKINKKGIEKVVIVGYGDDDADTAAKMVAKVKDGGISDAKVLTAGFSEWGKTDQDIINWGDPNSFVEQSKVEFIKTDELNRIISQGDSLYLIDLRTGSEFQKGHLPKAINLQLDELEAKRNELPKGKTIVVYSDNELDAYQAGVRLYDMHFALAQVYKEGFNSWKEKNLPIDK